MHLQRLQQTIGHNFKNPRLLQEALTHPSLAHEKGAHTHGHNQRLEFLGDAVLQLLLTDHIYQLHPNASEGQLTQIRAHLANRHTLHRQALAINLGDHLLLGKGEESSGGRQRPSNLADAFEALLGAIYLDGGIRAARKFVRRQFRQELRAVRTAAPRHNPKGHLQELLQARSSANPQYRVIHESGPDHNKHFVAVVEWEGREIGRGTGSSKKLAEVAAAQAALADLEKL
jgi:ribonuclease-3